MFQYDSNNGFFHDLRYLQNIENFLNSLIIKINGYLVFDKVSLPNNFKVQINDYVEQNRNLDPINSTNLGIIDKIALLIPNEYNFQPGTNKITIKSREFSFKFSHKTEITKSFEKIELLGASQLATIKQQKIFSDIKRLKVESSIIRIKRYVGVVFYSIYAVVAIYFLILINSIMSNPEASQTDATFGLVLGITFWIIFGFLLIPYVYLNFLRKK